MPRETNPCPVCEGDAGRLGGDLLAPCCDKHAKFNRIRERGYFRDGPVIYHLFPGDYESMIAQAQRHRFEQHAIAEAKAKLATGNKKVKP